MAKVKNIRSEVVMGIVSTDVAKTKTKRRRLVLSCGHLTGWRSIATPVPFLTICEVCTGPRKPKIQKPREDSKILPPREDSKILPWLLLGVSPADPMTRHKVVGYRDISGHWVFSFKEMKAAVAFERETVRNARD